MNKIHLIILSIFSGVSNGWKIPLVYVICSDKSAETYRRIFDELLNLQPNLNPATIVVDFELATIKAIKSIFPNAKIQGCHFHFKKNMIHQIGQNGLKVRYEKDAAFGHEVRMLMALAFVPPDLVVEAFEYFERNSKELNANKQKDDANIKGFVTNYFAKHYIGGIKSNGQRGKPQFPIEIWNVFESTLKGNSHHSLYIIDPFSLLLSYSLGILHIN